MYKTIVFSLDFDKVVNCYWSETVQHAKAIGFMFAHAAPRPIDEMGLVVEIESHGGIGLCRYL